MAKTHSCALSTLCLFKDNFHCFEIQQLILNIKHTKNLNSFNVTNYIKCLQTFIKYLEVIIFKLSKNQTAPLNNHSVEYLCWVSDESGQAVQITPHLWSGNA
ncbi:MAG: hypothetical protein CMC96_08600 [Flavobacteriales bacterium]|nr:hypothetical protein [Flavobacteriales bacterium]